MGIFQTAKSALGSLFASSSQAPSPSPSSLPTFPHFARLPPELRLKIWILSLEERIVPIHLHIYRNGVPITPPPAPSLFNPLAGLGQSDYRRQTPGRSQTIFITACTLTERCKCHTNPPLSSHLAPPPSAFSICRESRAATRHLYTQYFEHEYDIDGLPIPHLASLVADGRRGWPTEPKVGAVLNPTTDVLSLEADIVSQDTIPSIHHFVAIAASEIPGIRKIVFRAILGWSPYQWGERRRSERWRGWGRDGRWVSKDVLRFRGLRELVILVDGGTYGRMLPREWRERCKGIWREVVLGWREGWPVEWEGERPALKFVNSLKDV